MSKGGFLTPKAIANRIKSKGLQRLRWYCQMCEKQCRDENGFKNHISSESHLRQMKVFADNPGRYLSQFSSDFERGFLTILSHRHGTKRVKANQVYQEYIADKNHVHMNATSWSSLSGFVQYLGREGKVVAEDTEKGWYIQFIDRDPKLLAKQQQSRDRELAELNEEERQKMMIEAQIAAASSNKVDDEEDVSDSDRQLAEEHEKIEICIPTTKRPRLESSKRSEIFPAFNSANEKLSISNSSSSSKGQSTLDQLMLEEENRKQSIIKQQESLNRKDYWLHVGIVVRIKNKEISDSQGSLYNMKGEVIQVVDKYGGDIRMSDGAIVRLDQDDVETVVPKVGGSVIIVNGCGRGCLATLLKINDEEFNCDLRIDEGQLSKTVLKVAYEDFSKSAS